MSEQFNIDEYLGLSVGPDAESVTISKESYLYIRKQLSTLSSSLERVEGERDRYRLALENCYMMARRNIVRLGNSADKSLLPEIDKWGHIARFCEEAGLKSSPLREHPTPGDGQ